MQVKHYAVSTVDGMRASALARVLADGTFAKTAAGLPDEKKAWWADKLKPKFGNIYVVVISNGAGETYGPNVWGDYFNETSREQVGCEVPAGKPKSVMLDGGLKKYHKMYMEIGGAYKHHRNGATKDPLTGKPYQPLGKIGAEHYNDDMHRGELLLELPLSNWGDVNYELENDIPTCWSMSVGCPNDLCSNCLTRAKNRKVGCDCLRNRMGEILPNGEEIKAITDTSYYHDISYVKRNPALKIAFTLQKAAAGLGPRFGGVTIHEMQEAGLWLPVNAVPEIYGNAGARYNLLQKLAAAERDMEKQDAHAPDGAFSKGDDKASSQLVDTLKGLREDLPQIIGALNSTGMLLPARTFTCIVISKSKPDSSAATPGWVDLVPEEAQDIFDTVENDPELAASVTEDGSYPESGTANQLPSSARVGLSCLKGCFSSEPEAVRRRIVRTTAGAEEGSDDDKPAQKKASDFTDGDRRQARAMAIEYAKYLLSFTAATGTSPEYVALAKR